MRQRQGRNECFDNRKINLKIDEHKEWLTKQNRTKPEKRTNIQTSDTSNSFIPPSFFGATRIKLLIICISISISVHRRSMHAAGCFLSMVYSLSSPSLSAAFLIFSIDSTTQSNHFCSYRFIWRFISFFPQHRIFFFHSGLLLVHWVSFIPQTLIDNLHSSDWNVKANDRKKMQTTNGLDHVNLILSRFR